MPDPLPVQEVLTPVVLPIQQPQHATLTPPLLLALPPEESFLTLECLLLWGGASARRGQGHSSQQRRQEANPSGDESRHPRQRHRPDERHRFCLIFCSCCCCCCCCCCTRIYLFEDWEGVWELWTIDEEKERGMNFLMKCEVFFSLMFFFTMGYFFSIVPYYHSRFSSQQLTGVKLTGVYLDNAFSSYSLSYCLCYCACYCLNSLCIFSCERNSWERISPQAP
jgi:hypothetical protein